MAVEISLPRGSILDKQDSIKLNYFAADEGECLIFRVFIEAEIILFCVRACVCVRAREIPDNLIKNIFQWLFLDDYLMQPFFYKSLSGTRCISGRCLFKVR